MSDLRPSPSPSLSLPSVTLAPPAHSHLKNAQIKCFIKREFAPDEKEKIRKKLSITRLAFVAFYFPCAEAVEGTATLVFLSKLPTLGDAENCALTHVINEIMVSDRVEEERSEQTIEIKRNFLLFPESF